MIGTEEAATITEIFVPMTESEVLGEIISTMIDVETATTTTDNNSNDAMMIGVKTTIDGTIKEMKVRGLAMTGG